MDICFGIVSWLPDKEPDRTQRQNRLKRILKQLDELFPDIPVIIIAQNWGDYTPEECEGRLYIKRYDKLGILGARKELVRTFLNETFMDYVIMLDDDAIIECDTPEAPVEYIKTICEHPDGFAFIWDDKPKSNGEIYKSAQLNLCAISRYILTQEEFPDVNPEIGEGYEDCVFSHLLHFKYSNKEFKFNPNIRHIQFQNNSERVVSTWDWTKARTNGMNTSIFLKSFMDGEFNISEIKKRIDIRRPDTSGSRIYISILH